MPLFQCPRCGKRGVISSAYCEFLLKDTPFIQPEDQTERVYIATCPDCYAKVTVVEGNLLDQSVDVIVNAWNRNIIPWWLLLPPASRGRSRSEAELIPSKKSACMVRFRSAVLF